VTGHRPEESQLRQINSICTIYLAVSESGKRLAGHRPEESQSPFIKAKSTIHLAFTPYL